MTFHDFPAAHRRSIRTTDPTCSTFAAIRHRTSRPAGCPSGGGMLHVIFGPGMCARGRWRRLHGFGEPGKVITGVKFRNGIEEIEDAGSDNQPARIAA